ncbi:MAG TPA: adenylate/guanylate cyclase domain-containing protein [Actinomycetota bacterium]|jgi:class 3 adenylate cyclase/tetratricopeptide (TPR) repeat protein|nr:adenylate/guanylate cyclase domain-containing protein [Actinomycetota bacterium]
MRGCSNCGQVNPGGFRFCGACGSPLADVPRQPEGDERKVVTVLFCDLVGFTSRSDRADPEDVGAMLRPFHRRLRDEIERVGGTLDKLIGDAVMAVFGVPSVHEDDPERAVRCALRMLEAIAELNEAHPALELSVRIGINTGEALVALARSADSEGVVGDVVNTAARLQGVAPVNGVVVGEATWRATRTLFAYEQLAPVQVKGKTEPVPIFRVLGARSRPGVDVAERPATPLVGRDQELATLQRCYRKAFGEQSVQLVTILGEPGVGKSRLVRELAGFADAQPELVAWRRGHCLPYGEAGGFWALGEIIKAQAGILESDDPGEGAAKLDVAVRAVADDASEREWLKARLAPLVGFATIASPAAGRDESFMAWRRFLQLVAARGPLVLVIEDLHWADPALLDFLEQLLDQVDMADLLMVVTARPELLDRRPDWGGSRPNGTAVSLVPLDETQTAVLLGALLGQSLLPAEVQSLLLERTGGNPLYAEEFARLLTDRGVLTERGNLVGASDLPVPDTVQALIAARLDTLAPDHKTLLQDAAVFGKVFWSGALAAMGGASEQEIYGGLAQLERKELIRAARLSVVEDEAEYSFWHTLIRDVAYAQIPRTGRARRHRAAAEWIQALAGDRVADRAELIAYHVTQALIHARAAREPDLAELEGLTRHALVLAGDSTMGLDVAKAEGYYRQALALCPPGTPGRAQVLARAARAAFQAGRVTEAASAYEEAIEGFAAEGNVVGQGEALNRLSSVLWNQGETRRTRDALVRAVELLERAPPGPELCSAYAQMAMDRVMGGHPQEALGWADKALELADELGGLPEERLRALDSRGVARGDLGDLGGMDDLRAALTIGLEIGAGYDTAVVYNNLIEPLWLTDGPAAALETCQEAIEFTERRGLVEGTVWIRSATLTPLLDLGRWDEAVDTANALISWERDHGGQYLSEMAHQIKAQVLLWRGEVNAARALAWEFLPRARAIDDLQLLVPALAVAAAIEQASGQHTAARGLVEEIQRVVGDRGGGRWYLGQHIADLVRVCLAMGRRATAEALAAQAHDGVARNRHGLLAAHAALAEGAGELDQAALRYDEAAAHWADYGHQLERARALLGAGRCHLALGRPESQLRVRDARIVLASLHAELLLAEADIGLRDTTTQRHNRRG